MPCSAYGCPATSNLVADGSTTWCRAHILVYLREQLASAATFNARWHASTHEHGECADCHVVSELAHDGDDSPWSDPTCFACWERGWTRLTEVYAQAVREVNGGANTVQLH